MRRISPFSWTGFIAWCFLGEAVLAYLHLGEFSVRLAKGLLGFAETHFFWDLGVGLAMLLVLNQWPNIEPKIPSWMKFKTTHERLHAIEGELIPAVNKRCTALTSSVTEIEGWRTELNKKLPELVTAVGAVQRGLSKIEADLDTPPDIAGIAWIEARDPGLNAAGMAIPGSVLAYRCRCVNYGRQSCGRSWLVFRIESNALLFNIPPIEISRESFRRTARGEQINQEGTVIVPNVTAQQLRVATITVSLGDDRNTWHTDIEIRPVSPLRIAS